MDYKLDNKIAMVRSHEITWNHLPTHFFWWPGHCTLLHSLPNSKNWNWPLDPWRDRPAITFRGSPQNGRRWKQDHGDPSQILQPHGDCHLLSFQWVSGKAPLPDTNLSNQSLGHYGLYILPIRLLLQRRFIVLVPTLSVYLSVRNQFLIIQQNPFKCVWMFPHFPKSF